MENEIIEEQNIECPVCNESFKDLRGLTSHARHGHKLTKEEIYNMYFEDEKNKEDSLFKMLVGAGGFLLALITIGKRS